MNEHRGHNILGRYCWTCHKVTETGIPYWPIAHNGEFTHYSVWTVNPVTGKGYTKEIVWANGDVERKRDQTKCAMCGKHCKYPVNRAVTENGDNYREIGQIRVW
jgi:hypothetical protein